MKFVCSKNALLRPLQQVVGVVERRQTLPVLANVLVVAGGAEDAAVVTLTGTDLEVELVGQLAATVDLPGSVTIPARKFVDIVRQLPDGVEIGVELTGDKVVIRSGRFKSSLSTLPAIDFPTVDSTAAEVSTVVEASQFKRLLDQTAFGMAIQDVRFFLNGMLLEVGANYLRSVTTDGHRLSLATQKCENGERVHKQVIVPRKGVLELLRLLADSEGEVRLELGSSHLHASTNVLSMTTKLIDGRFPDYERVIPRNGDKVVVADREAFHQMLSRTAILSNEKYRAIRFVLADGLITLSASNAEHESAQESLSVEYAGPEVEIGFNAGYVQDVLSVLKGSEIRLTLHDENSSAVLEDPDTEDALYVVMPMKL